MKMKEYVSFFRPEIEAMSGYVPGEQPKARNIVKLNTNENPYPPSPGVLRTLQEFDYGRLRLYPDPLATELRAEIGAAFGMTYENVIAGNGSDDILNIAMRCFCGPGRPMACLDPSYSLYPSLAEIQGAPCIRIPLNDDFSLPENLEKQAEGAFLLMIARPNAPTGNSFPKERIAEICENFQGIVLIDEAYADFARDNCADLLKEYPNLILSRTFSKSRSLAGLRFGYAVAHEKIIEGMMKVKDSYNVSMLTQKLALASLWDRAYFQDCVAKVKLAREMLSLGLWELGFTMTDTETNFVFASPPDGDGEKYFRSLREHDVLVRYFPGPMTGRYVRITVGTTGEMADLVSLTEKLYS